jgi:hypothetical protein
MAKNTGRKAEAAARRRSARKLLGRVTKPPDTESNVKKANEILDQVAKAKERHSTWINADPGGRPSEIKLKELECEAAARALDDVNERLAHARGDFLSDAQIAPKSPIASAKIPAKSETTEARQAPTDGSASTRPANPAASVPPNWKVLARTKATEFITRQRAKDLFPSQVDVADEIARDFRASEIVGDGGKPLTGAYIKRHALKGISSARGKQLSTSPRQGK